MKEEAAALPLLFHIIEQSALVEAGMQAATLLQAVLIQRFASMSRTQREEVKNHCMQIVLRQGCHPVVTGQLLTVVAILFKKGWLLLSDTERQDGIHAAQQLVQNPDTVYIFLQLGNDDLLDPDEFEVLQMAVGVDFIGALLGVFANTRGAFIGTSMLQYVDIRRSFEVPLPYIYSFCTGGSNKEE